MNGLPILDLFPNPASAKTPASPAAKASKFVGEPTGHAHKLNPSPEKLISPMLNYGI
jgi:hypothetical protein